MNKRICYLLLLAILLPFNCFANLEEADEAYMRGEFEKAAQFYEDAVKVGGNADAYYNLGNCYYRMEDLGHAVLNYERALLLAPDNADVQFNLELVNTKIIDQFNSTSEMFFITWLRDFIMSKQADQWAYWGLFFFTLAIVTFLIYRVASRVGIRKLSFFTALLCFLLSLSTNAAAAWYNYSLSHDGRAVVVRQSSLYATNNEKDAPLRELHPGTIVEVMDENSRGWMQVELKNGKKGWMNRTDAINIVQ